MKIFIWDHNKYKPLNDLLLIQEKIKQSIGLEFRLATRDEVRAMLVGMHPRDIDKLADFWKGLIVVKNSEEVK